MKYITAKEARELADESVHTDNLDKLFAWIKGESEAGHKTGTYADINLTDEEIRFIRKQGYYIYWNGILLQYELEWN
jgi:hypothetical protein